MLIKLTSQSLAYGSVDFFTKLVQFVVFPFLALTFGATGFGQLELLMTLVLLLGLIGNFGVNNSIQRYFWDKFYTKRTQAENVSVGLMLLVIFMSMTSLAFALFSLAPGVRDFLGIDFLHIIAAIISFAFSNQIIQFSLDVLRLRENVKLFFLLAFISRPLCLICAVIIQYQYQNMAHEFFTLLSLLTLATLPFSLYFIRDDLCLTKNFIISKKLISFGYPFIFSGIAYWLFSATDRWMIAYYHGDSEVGNYSVAFRVASISIFVITAFGQAWNPISIKIRTFNPGSYRSIYGNMLYILIAIMYPICLGLAIFYKDILILLSLDVYVETTKAFILITAGNFIYSLFQIVAIGISLSQRTIFFAYISGLAALVNIALNIFLIPEYGIMGAALATLLTQVSILICYLELTQKLYPISVKKWKLYAILNLILINFFILYNSSSLLNEFTHAQKLILFTFLGLTAIVFTIRPIRELTTKTKIQLGE